MKKNWIALLLALCMMAALGVASACRTEPTGMEEPQTMEETCACMMDGKGVDGCECMDGMCGDKCACGEGCKCAEKRLDMLAAEMNALFEKNMELWNKLFGMMSKQPDMSMTYADYLMEQLEAAREKFTQDEYKLLQQDIETIRRLDEEMSKLQEKMMPGDTMTMDPSMQDGMTVDGSMAMMEDDTAPKFPAFEGMDLDGNAVTSELFKDNSVTVINFWFSGCAPCIGELGELNTLNETLSVPVLSEQITCVQPSVSTAVRRRMTAFSRDIFVTPMESTTVTTVASPSGMAATARETATMKVFSTTSSA